MKSWRKIDCWINANLHHAFSEKKFNLIFSEWPVNVALFSDLKKNVWRVLPSLLHVKNYDPYLILNQSISVWYINCTEKRVSVWYCFRLASNILKVLKMLATNEKRKRAYHRPEPFPCHWETEMNDVYDKGGRVENHSRHPIPDLEVSG